MIIFRMQYIASLESKLLWGIQVTSTDDLVDDLETTIIV